MCVPPLTNEAREALQSFSVSHQGDLNPSVVGVEGVRGLVFTLKCFFERQSL